MKKVLITCLAALGLMGCANQNYQIYAETTKELLRENAATKQANFAALATIVDKVGPEMRGFMAAKLLDEMGKPVQGIAKPDNDALEWAKVLANPLTTLGMGGLQFMQFKIGSNNALATRQSDNEIIKDAVNKPTQLIPTDVYFIPTAE